MLYLFCNDRVGGPFLKAAISFCAERSLPLTLVHSIKRESARGKLSRSYWRARVLSGTRAESRRLGVPVMLVEDVNADAFREDVSAADDGVVAGFNQIFKPETIARFRSLVNFHPSVLPLYRGPVPSYWCLRNGEVQTGYTLHEVTAEIDAGRILFQEAVAIDEGMDQAALDDEIWSRGARTLPRYLEHLLDGEPWTPVVLDAYSIYRTHLDYASFPPSKE